MLSCTLRSEEGAVVVRLAEGEERTIGRGECRSEDPRLSRSQVTLLCKQGKLVARRLGKNSSAVHRASGGKQILEKDADVTLADGDKLFLLHPQSFGFVVHAPKRATDDGGSRGAGPGAKRTRNVEAQPDCAPSRVLPILPERLKEENLKSALPMDDRSPAQQIAPDPIQAAALASVKRAKQADFCGAQKIGAGGFGDVYSATWAYQRVAVKRIRSKEHAADLFREAAVMFFLRHTRLVTILAISDESEMRPFFVSEYMEGGSLFDALHSNKNPLPYECNLQIARDVASAVAYLHAEKVIHRDLKSANVLLSGDRCRAKVADFGLAKFSVHAEAAQTVAGTRYWMAPEVLTGKYTHAADVYSYGLVLYELVARRVPFQENGGLKWPQDATLGHRPALPSSVHPDWTNVIQCCWHVDPGKRPTMDTISKHLGL